MSSQVQLQYLSLLSSLKTWFIFDTTYVLTAWYTKHPSEAPEFTPSF